MTLKEFQYFFSKELSFLYPKTEIDTFFFLLIEEVLNLKRVDVILMPEFIISSEKLELLSSATQRLLKEEPIQYILGKTEFYGLPFLVTKNTLIPRPETEELVDWVLNEIEHTEFKTVSLLDIGTGTGCIAISLKKNLANAKISAIDVSKEALKIAKENAKLNSTVIEFMNKDILKTKRLSQKYDIIISNPPYVRALEKVALKNNVLKNEPHLALFVSNEDPLIFYKKIAELAKHFLKEKGVLFFEINQYLAKETITMLTQKGFKNIELKRDFAKNNRMVKAYL